MCVNLNAKFAVKHWDTIPSTLLAKIRAISLEKRVTASRLLFFAFRFNLLGYYLLLAYFSFLNTISRWMREINPMIENEMVFTRDSLYNLI
jgi:uncharacterized membrane protein YqhA